MSAASPSAVHRRRTAARLAAVQALYEMEVADVAADGVLREQHRPTLPAVDNDESGRLATEADPEFFERLVRGVDRCREDIDRRLAAALRGGLDLARLEVVLRAILRCGAFELMAMPEVPARVVITEYLELAHAFFGGKEPPLVNAVLDRLAEQVRGPDGGG